MLLSGFKRLGIMLMLSGTISLVTLYMIGPIAKRTVHHHHHHNHYVPAPEHTIPKPSAAPLPSGPCAKAEVGIKAIGLAPGWTFVCQNLGHAGIADFGTQTVYVRPGEGPGVGAHEAAHSWQDPQAVAANPAAAECQADVRAAQAGYPSPYPYKCG